MSLILFVAAVVPSIILGALILKMDWFESEPRKTLAMVFGLGCLSCIPAGILEGIGQYVIQLGALPPIVSTILMFLVVVPLAEEGCKYCAMGIVGKRPEYNCVFDGVVYGAVSALGFATLENIGYVITAGTMDVALFRAITAVPMHCAFGVFMGYYYSEARISRDMGDQQGSSLNKRKAIAIPALFHGVYDATLAIAGTQEIYAFALVALAFTVWVLIRAVKRVRESSKNDRPFASAGPIQTAPTAGVAQQATYQQQWQQQYPQQQVSGQWSQQAPNQRYWPQQQVPAQWSQQQAPYPQPQQAPQQQQWSQQQVPYQQQRPQQQAPYPQQQPPFQQQPYPQQQPPSQWPQQPRQG